MSQDNHLLSAQVYRRIRDGILCGKYAADTELKEKTIGDELGVSRTPVREALRQLELEGLVSIIPNKGAYVVGVSLQDMHDIYEIRSLLEGLCAKWAATHITPELLTELEENICLSEFHESKQNFEQMVSLDNRFHEILYEASGSRELKKVLKEYHEYLQRARSVTLAQAQRAKNSTQEHKMIADAIKNHDSASAERYAKAHIESTMLNMDKIGWENLMK